MMVAWVGKMFRMCLASSVLPEQLAPLLMSPCRVSAQSEGDLPDANHHHACAHAVSVMNKTSGRRKDKTTAGNKGVT